MTTLLGVSVDAGAPAINARAVVVPIAVSGVNDAAALARQQLINAVPAPAGIAAYSTSVAPQPKPQIRATIALPSSPLAAQFIAQNATESIEELAIFTPRSLSAALSDVPAQDDYLSALRIARGDLGAVTISVPAAAAPSQQATKIMEQAQIATTKTTLNAANETIARSVVAQAAAGLPALFTQFIRKPTIPTVRGFGAYQLAEARNAATRKTVAATQ